ncbi:C3H1-type domain-containing protein (Fragment) [Durusdinium trenchii]|uniref:C3H1-type domain-containing protein n=1 Tax=Durusdinium trenchii TaxID=1381693 RepID=A0ABP0JEQ9_9DINO
MYPSSHFKSTLLSFAANFLPLTTAEPPKVTMHTVPSSGTNQSCRVPEKASMPSAQDVVQSFPLRNTSRPQSSFSLDVRIHPSEHGLVGFTFQNRLFFLPLWSCVRPALVGPSW